MDELKTIISCLCKSDYLPEWIIKLKDNDVLFSPQKNIKPCIQVDAKTIRSNIWNGLLLFDNYCSKGFKNDEVDEFIISIINESILMYETDNETDAYKKLNSSSAILHSLLVIILYRHQFINNVDLVSFVKIYLDSVSSWPFSLVYEMYKAKEVLLKSDKKKVFEAYSTIIKSKNKEEEYKKYFIVEDLILQNPYDYYNYSKEYILNNCASKLYLDLGAFFEYANSYTHYEDLNYFWWLKISSLRIDDYLLHEDIKSFIQSENEFLNKIGLCLINLNFKRINDLFFDNLNLFFSKESFYADLRCVFNNCNTSIFTEENHAMLVKALDGASFGLKKGKALSALKNHICKIYNANGFDVSFYEEKASDLEYVMNFNKRVYSVISHRTDNVKDIKDKISGKKIDEAIKLYLQLSNGSYYFSNAVYSAFREYLFEFYPNDYVSYLGFFDSSFLASLLYYLVSDENDTNKGLKEVIVKVIELIKNNDVYKECISALLYCIEKLSNSIDAKELKDLVFSIDYRWISIDEYEETKDVITACINENLHTYFELLGYVAQISGETSFLRDAINYHIEKNNCAKLKSIFAFIFPRLVSCDKNYALSLIDYIFNNTIDGKNLSYPLLSISNGLNEIVMGIIADREDLKAYLSTNAQSGNDRMGLSTIAQWYFRSFIFNGKYENLIQIQFENIQFDVILDCIRSMNYWFEYKVIKNGEIVEYKKYFEMFDSMLKDCDLIYPEIDQLIRAVANTIILSKNFDEIVWEVLLSLFQWFNNYFSDDCVELIKKYKGERKNEITKLLNIYFGSYDPYLTYEQTLIEVYNLVASDKLYQGISKEWKVSLLSKNIALKDKLIS